MQRYVGYHRGPKRSDESHEQMPVTNRPTAHMDHFTGDRYCVAWITPLFRPIVVSAHTSQDLRFLTASFSVNPIALSSRAQGRNESVIDSGDFVDPNLVRGWKTLGIVLPDFQQSALLLTDTFGPPTVLVGTIWRLSGVERYKARTNQFHIIVPEQSTNTVESATWVKKAHP